MDIFRNGGHYKLPSGKKHDFRSFRRGGGVAMRQMIFY